MNTANVTLDMKGLSCPGPLIAAKRLVDELEAGQILLLLSDCPGTKDDLYVWAKQTGNTVLQAQKMPEGGIGYYIQKGQGVARKANVVLDIRGVVCPGPIVEAKKLLNGMQAGEVLKLISNCPGIKSDIIGWASATKIELAETLEIAPGEFEFYVRKT
jgi:TusA-related sulfurtransferase